MQLRSDEATIKDRLIGSWFADLGGQAGVGYVFNEDNTFEYNLGITSGSLVQVEAYLGDYELRDGATAIADDDGASLFLQATAGTCPGAWTGSHVVAFVGDSLRLVNDGGATVLQRASDEGDASGIVSSFFSNRPWTVEWLMLSTTPSSTSWSQSRCRVQRLRDSGGVLQASWTKRASPAG